MYTKLAFARDMVACLGGFDLIHISGEDRSVASLIRDTFYGSVFPGITDQSVEMYLDQLESGRVYFLNGILGMSYIAMRLEAKQEYLIAGPCRLEEFSETKLRTSLHPYDLNHAQIQQVLTYCRWQPFLSPEKFHQLGILLGRHLLDLTDPVDYQHIEYRWNRSLQPIIMEAAPYADQSKIREIEMRYETSTALTEAVKAGNLSLAMRYIQGIYAGITSMVRNPDPMRNAQNMCIVLNTQLRYALEEKKIHPYRLDTVSSKIGREIEALRSLEDVSRFFSHILRQYCELALEKNYSHLESLSRQAVVYIKNHLTDNLTVKETAKALLVNANYLSGKFHREVGMTFTDFVNQQRTEQAASLLRHTNLHIQQIAAAVGYNNASHFAKQFYRFYGLTPRDYRKQNKL